MDKTVLIVDDEEINRELFCQILNTRGYDMLEADSGVQAIEVVQSKKPDLILLDLFMPNGDGMSVLQAVRGNPETKDIPIVVVTAAVNDDVLKKTQELGCNALVRKPVDMQLLLSTVDQLLTSDNG
ncbi:MAG: CheY-like chemotaxis protein [Candidatus Latescibacterota bacterium]|jgi:CheY-like chemotaxis protein